MPDALDDGLRDLLLDAVPPLTAPADRLVRVAGRVRARRRRRAARTALGAALAVTAVAGGVPLLPPDGVTTVRPARPPAAATSPSAPTAPAVVGTATATAGPAAPSGGASRSGPPVRTGTRDPSPAAAGDVRYDPARIPAGSAGSDRRRVVATAEQPAAGDGTGIFRTVCLFARMGTDDVAGGGTVPLRTYAGRAAGGRGTCRGGAVDRSVYWTPSLVDTATGTPVAPDAVHVYYSSGYAGVSPDDVRTPPAGLTAVADGGTAGGHAWWTCAGSPAHRTSVPDCAGEIELTVVLPQCWDGRRTDSPGHRAHLARPTGTGCPAGHPVALPEVTLSVRYTPGGANGSPRDWRLTTDAAGAPAGSSATGGWVDDWDPAISAAWVEHCVRAAVSCGSHLLGDGRALEGDA